MTSIPADNKAPSHPSSPTTPPPPAQDSTPSQIIVTAQSDQAEALETNELEEIVEGQHPNYIDGVWHCSNCGCPASVAAGRRSGPLGDKSQCGICGKFWHRHRRPRPVEYNPDPKLHSAIGQKVLEI